MTPAQLLLARGGHPRPQAHPHLRAAPHHRGRGAHVRLQVPLRGRQDTVHVRRQEVPQVPQLTMDKYGVSDLIVSIMLVLIYDQRGLKCCKTEQKYYIKSTRAL